jgi:hypothetical protein
MGLFDGLKFWDKNPTSDVKKKATTYGGITSSGIITNLSTDFLPNQQGQSIDTAFRNSITIFTALDWKASKASNCPLLLYKISNKSKAYDYFQYAKDQSPRNQVKALKYKSALIEVEDSSDPLKALLANPHPTFSFQELSYIAIVSKVLTGNSIETLMGLDDIITGQPKITRLVPMPTNRVTIIGGNNANAPQYYRYTALDSFQHDYPPQDIMHVRNSFGMNYNHNQIYTGMSQLQAGIANIEISRQGELARGQQFKNGGAAGILMEKQEEIESPETGEIDEFQQRLDNKILGVDKLNKLIYFPREMGFLEIGKSVVDMAILENEKTTSRALCAMMGIDPAVLGIDTESGMGNGGNKKEGIIKSYNDGVLPELHARQEVLNKMLCPRFGDSYHVEYDVMSFSPLASQRLDYVKEANLLEVLSKNEVRELIGFDHNEDPLCNEIWGSTSKQPLSEFALNSAVNQMNVVNDGSF